MYIQSMINWDFYLWNFKSNYRRRNYFW